VTDFGSPSKTGTRRDGNHPAFFVLPRDSK